MWHLYSLMWANSDTLRNKKESINEYHPTRFRAFWNDKMSLSGWNGGKHSM